MKKIISLLSALAIFSSMAVTGFAADVNGVDKKTADNQPKIQVWVSGETTAEGYVDIYVKLINNEELVKYSLKNPGAKVTANGISMIQTNLILDGDVFNDGDVWSTSFDDSKFVVGNQGALEPTMAFTPGATIANWLDEASEVPEYLFLIQASTKEGYDKTNIPLDAISFDTCKVEYSSYNGVATSAGKTTYTIYGTENAAPKDYILECKFTGTSTEWPEEGGETVTPVAMDAGVEIAEGPYAGMTSVSAPEAVAVADFAKIEITNDVDTSKTLEWTAPTTLGDGKTNVLAVLVFDKVEMAGSTFTVKYLNAASEAIKIFTHEVTE